MEKCRVLQSPPASGQGTPSSGLRWWHSGHTSQCPQLAKPLPHWHYLRANRASQGFIRDATAPSHACLFFKSHNLGSLFYLSSNSQQFKFHLMPVQHLAAAPWLRTAGPARRACSRWVCLCPPAVPRMPCAGWRGHAQPRLPGFRAAASFQTCVGREERARGAHVPASISPVPLAPIAQCACHNH